MHSSHQRTHLHTHFHRKHRATPPVELMCRWMKLCVGAVVRLIRRAGEREPWREKMTRQLLLLPSWILFNVRLFGLMNFSSLFGMVFLASYLTSKHFNCLWIEEMSWGLKSRQQQQLLYPADRQTTRFFRLLTFPGCCCFCGNSLAGDLLEC